MPWGAQVPALGHVLFILFVWGLCQSVGSAQRRSTACSPPPGHTRSLYKGRGNVCPMSSTSIRVDPGTLSWMSTPQSAGMSGSCGANKQEQRKYWQPSNCG